MRFHRRDNSDVQATTQTHRTWIALGLASTLGIAAAACGGGESAPGSADAPAEAAAERAPKVLLIGIDGVRPDVLAGVSTPNLDALRAEGAYSDEAQTGLPTVSGPSWSSMLTGVWSDKHGVVDNSFEGKNYAAYPDFLTRIEQVRSDLETLAIADWTPLVSEEGGGPLIGDAPDEVVTLNGYDLGWAEADALSVDVAVDRLGRRDVDALFVYLGNPDETSHGAGSIGVEYQAAIAEADRQVGRLIEAVTSRATYAGERWLVLVSTDHGRSENGGHGGDSPEERTIFVIVSGPDAARGRLASPPEIVDVAVTALTHMGISVDPTWGLDGTPIGLR